MRKLNLAGKKFNKWTVIKEGPKRGKKNRWLCLCECGRKDLCYVSDLTSGKSSQCRSCAVKRHGHTADGGWRTREYSSWGAMKQRCYNPNHSRYIEWGGRGITVCKPWRDSFEQFLEDMGPCPSDDHSIDRINNDEDYTPENCHWATRSQQQLNRRDR